MRRSASVALFALLLGLTVTYAVSQALSASLRAEAKARFDGAARRLELDVLRRINQAQYGLRGLAASFASQGELTTEQFRDWVQARDMPQEFPGVLGFGLVRRVARADLEAFTARMQQADPKFTVKAEGNAADLYVVTEVEPRAANLVAYGFDLGQEPMRRLGLERAVASGEMALTDRVALMQDNVPRAGWNMLLPVFRKGQDPRSPLDRSRALVGLLYARIIAADVFAQSRGTFGPELDFRLYDGPVNEGQLLFDSMDEGSPAIANGARVWKGRALHAERTLQIGGQDLTLDIAGRPGMEADAFVPLSAAVVGAMLSVLLAFSIWQLANGRRKAEAMASAMTRELSASEAFLEQAQRLAHIGGWEVDLETSAVRLSAQMLRLFDLPAQASPTIEEFIGFFVPKSQQAIEAATQLAVREGKPWDLELRLVSAKGTKRWVRTVGQVERENGRSLRLVGTLQDITDRKQAEEALRASENLMRVVTDNLPGRVGYWDRDLRCRFGNRYFAETFGLTQGEVIGVHLPALLGPERYGAIQADVQAALDGQPRAIEREERWREGQVQTMIVHYIPDARDGEVHGFFVLALDVTELKNAREAAQQASAAKGQFLANTSHELRTPMNAVIGMLTLLGQTELSPRQADYVHKADGAARSLLALLNDILDFSKVEAGKLALDPRPFKIETLLHDVSVILSANPHTESVEILFDMDGRLPSVLVGDDMRLRQILINLGGNAVKFTERGEVVVAARLVERSDATARIEFSVSDTGIGIAKEQQSRIFEGFSQAEASTVRKYGGTGLGLAISQRLVALMGSSLQVESEPGRGSRFFFTLELPIGRGPRRDTVPAELTSQFETTGPPGDNALSGLRLLVVEDNAINQEVARDLLMSHGAKVDIAGDGRQAVNRVTSHPSRYDLVLMDVQMPVMDGFTATREIRAAGLQLPIVAMTANAMSGDREACLQAGMDDHVGKPFDVDELVKAILHHVGQSSAMPVAAPASTPVPAAVSSQVDLAAAVKRLGGDINFYKRLYPSVKADTHAMLERLDALVAEGQRGEAGRLFHTIKGLAGTMGATVLSRAAAEAEQAMSLPVRDAAADSALVASTRRAYEAACAELDQRLGT